MEEQTESWQLGSGTWYRDSKSETWRLEKAFDGTVVNAKLSTQDLGRMIGARRETASSRWFPPDFNYSPQTGTPLDATGTCVDLPWVPPFGAPALSNIAKPLSTGVRQTPASLALARSNGGPDVARDPDRTLPALAPGQYRFLVHKFDVTSPTLMAMEPERGSLLVLLPESNAWIALEPAAAGGVLAAGLRNSGGWRMEVVEEGRSAALYLPTARGLAVLRPTLVGLSYAAEYFGDGPALGGPVAWAGDIWLPLLGRNGAVNLVAKPRGGAEPMVLPTRAPVPENGFEAPVFDRSHVIWPSEDGELIVRLDPTGKKQTGWTVWPAGLRPRFLLGCPYHSPSGTFWQLCSGQDGSLEYVQMGELFPQSAAIDAPRLGTGHISYTGEHRIEGDPWKQPPHRLNGASSKIVLPLIESEWERAVVGLRIDAPHGVLALLESGRRRHRAVLQLQAQNRPDVLFGNLSVARPWLTSLFVYDAHLWVYHPELPQALGWKLES